MHFIHAPISTKILGGLEQFLKPQGRKRGRLVSGGGGAWILERKTERKEKRRV